MIHWHHIWNLSFSSSRWGYRPQSCLQAESLCSVADHFHSVLQVSHLEEWWHDSSMNKDGCSEILDDGRYMNRCNKNHSYCFVMRNKILAAEKELLEHTAPEEELAMSRSCFSVFVRGPLAFLKHRKFLKLFSRATRVLQMFEYVWSIFSPKMFAWF